MESQLTVGKTRGLDRVSNEGGIFSILAFDHRQSFARMLPQTGKPAGYAEIASVKMQVISTIAHEASAVLLDPVYSAAQSIISGALPGDTGLIMALEETGYSGENTSRISEILPGWNVAKTKSMGSDAVKLLVYYHPDAGDITKKQEELCAMVIEECRSQDIAFFLEPIIYSINTEIDNKSAWFAKQRPQVLLETARRLSSLHPDVLKLEFPVDASHDRDQVSWQQACEQISEACSCPWAVLSAGVDFETFANQVETACKAGASGFIGGRAIWKEGISLPERERISWLERVALDRLLALSEIANHFAVPWRNFYQPVDLAALEGWYRDYP
jgi:tagatose 1,6-diphosphate aldolase